MRRLEIECLSEAAPGPVWASLFERFWPAYRAWHLRGAQDGRPGRAECRDALAEHMPELLTTYDRLVELGGGGELEAHALSVWCPPPFMSGCSQAVWTRGPGPGPLFRSYEYNPDLFEGLLLRTQWTRRVMGMSDCLWGLLDGVNDAGLCVALAFGGRNVVGRGFGIPIALRYILEACTSTAQACATLARLPIHMAYNVSLVDARGEFAVVEVGPDRPALVRRDAVATNHQAADDVSRPRPDGPTSGGTPEFSIRYARATSTHERERFLREALSDKRQTPATLEQQFLGEPLFSCEYERGWGSLYLARYDPAACAVHLRWRGDQVIDQSLAKFQDRKVTIELSGSVPPARERPAVRKAARQRNKPR